LAETATCPENKKAVVASLAPRLLKEFFLNLGSFKSRGAARAPKIIIAKIKGALPKLHGLVVLDFVHLFT
jgi:hypothetical protein